MSVQRLTSPQTLLLGLILLVALGLRLFHLDGQSLWYDEGVSAFMTRRTFAEIAAATSVDIHPPLYYWLLSLWAVPFGQGEIALRSLSVVLGTVTVWATYRLGRMLAGAAVGLAAAALLAVSPLAVQYSQEVRMYALASLLAVASSWAGLALLRAVTKAPALASPTTHGARLPLPLGEGRSAGALAVVYGLLAAALLYTHYYGSLVIIAQQVFAGIVLLRTRCWGIVPFWALGSGLAALLFLPWLPVALRQTGYYPGLGSPQPAWALVLDAVNVLSIGVATTRFAFRIGLAPFVALAVAGVWTLVCAGVAAPRPYSDGESPAPSRGEPVARPLLAALLPLLWLALPIIGIVVLSRSRPLYEPRFLMLVLPAWTILVGAGLVGLGRVVGLGIASTPLPTTARVIVASGLALTVSGMLLIPTTRSLASYYFDPVYARDDYRGLAQTVALREQPGDAVVLTAPGQVEIFGYYYRGRADVFPLPAQRPLDPADTRSRLDMLGTDHDRVWLVRWAANEADPDDLILGWLEAHGRAVGGQRFGQVELRLYDLHAAALTQDRLKA
jgi:uncharacterized membrane protein